MKNLVDDRSWLFYFCLVAEWLWRDADKTLNNKAEMLRISPGSCLPSNYPDLVMGLLAFATKLSFSLLTS